MCGQSFIPSLLSVVSLMNFLRTLVLPLICCWSLLYYNFLAACSDVLHQIDVCLSGFFVNFGVVLLEEDKCQQLVLCIYDELNPLTGIARVAYPAGTVHLSEHCIPVSSADTRRHLRSANRHLLAVPRFPLNTYGRRTFSVAGPMAWNSLPDFIQRDPTSSTDCFRRLLKTHLFSLYWCIQRISGS